MTQPDNIPGGMPWSQQRRLEFIDFRLRWDGVLNRSDLKAHFGISIPQASNDIAAYTAQAAHNLAYDRSSRSYAAPAGFSPLYSSSGAQQYLAQLHAVQTGAVPAEELFLGYAPPTALVPLPVRSVDDQVLLQLVRAIRDRLAVEVDYQSITRDEARRRVITPLALAQDGQRWHVRAFCSFRHGFRDFVIGRIVRIHRTQAAATDLPEDLEWNRMVDVILAPHPSLGIGPRLGIEVDFRMKHGEVTVPCRQALLFYLFRSLGLNADGTPQPNLQQVVVKNLSALQSMLPTPGQP